MRRPIAVALLAALPWAALSAQGRILRVVGDDGRPIVYASVWLGGSASRLTGDSGSLALPDLSGPLVKVSVRRIGYAPWEGSFAASDTATVWTVTMARLATPLPTVEVREPRSAPLTLALQGFYRRALERQKGALTGTFLTPEAIERRDPTRVTQLLQDVHGVTLRRSRDGQLAAFGLNGTCRMAVVIDGVRTRSPWEAKVSGIGGASIQPRPGPPGTPSTRELSEDNAVFIDRLVAGMSVAAVEVYPRGGNIPIELQQTDQGCGVIFIWTGARR